MKLIVGNLKMYMKLTDIVKYVESLDGSYENVVVCPTDIHIPYFLKRGFKVGIQNVFYEDVGAYTGEVSPLQAFELGIEYVILGHSERRKYFKEDNEMIKKKINQSLKNNLNVILCVGSDDNLETINKELENVDKNVIVAYEPNSAIGTGNIPSLESIEKMINYIKSKGFNKVLYGGSVDIENVSKIIPLTDGLLIGSASCNVNKFKEIIEVVNNG